MDTFADVSSKTAHNRVEHSTRQQPKSHEGTYQAPYLVAVQQYLTGRSFEWKNGQLRRRCNLRVPHKERTGKHASQQMVVNRERGLTQTPNTLED
eukprot:2517455-Amphidinium_carterae.1